MTSPLPGRIALLGSTGSIGQSTLRIVRALPGRLKVSLLAAGSNVDRLAEQVREFHPEYAVIGDVSKYESLQRQVPPDCKVLAGPDALKDAMSLDCIDTVLCAIVGTGGLQPSLRAIEAGKTLALASKEVMVMAGRIVTDAAVRKNVKILPVDSEHSAIFQCLEGRAPDSVAELLLTASGGPFRTYTPDQLNNVTWAQAMAHPTWNMGPKVTLDSASLMNKALEMIEARWLFRTPVDHIGVVVHPQSIVHSMVRFTDGAVLALLSRPDMGFPIQYALCHPDRPESGLPYLDFRRSMSLTFEAPDETRFPALRLAREALIAGKTMPAVLNAANETAFERFKAGEIRFPEIWRIVEKTMSALGTGEDDGMDAVMTADAEARRCAALMR